MKKNGVYFCAPASLERVYGPSERSEIARRFNMAEPPITRDNWREHRDLLHRTDVIVSSWQGAVLDEELLDAMPHLKMYFYGAGTIQGLMTEAAWERGIRITSAVAANAVPVAEFCLAQILFSLKHGWKYMRLTKEDNPQYWQCNKPVPGNYQSRIGIISLGQISKKLCELLLPYDFEVFVSTRHQDPVTSQELGFTFSSVEEIFDTCDVVSIHLPNKEATRGIINGELLSRMKKDATLINTARGAVINQNEMIEFLRERTDITACLDVTDPEPPESGCPLFDLPNVVLTPHLAGSMGPEARRMAAYIIEEMDRWLAGEPLQHEITRAAAAEMA